MSGSKSGEIAIAPVAIGGVVAAGAVIVVGGIALGIGAAVAAYRAERERIRKAREQATNEQRTELDKAMDEWRKRMAASAGPADPAPNVRSGEEIIAGMVTPLSESSSLRAEDYLNGILAGASEAASPSPPPQAVESGQYRQVIDNIQELLDNLNIPLPGNVAAKLASLQRGEDVERVAAIAREIRVEISREKDRMKQEQQEARRVLDDLPPDFPESVRNVVCEAAEGRGRFDDHLRDIVRKTMEQVEVCRQREAANILLKTLSEMGYEVEPVGESLIADVGKVHFRNSEWEDGYCVRLGVKGDHVNFNMMKTCASGRDADLDAERGWDNEFAAVRERLAENGVTITNYKVNSVPGKTEVPPVKGDISIDTRKKAKKKAEAKAHQSNTGGQR